MDPQATLHRTTTVDEAESGNGLTPSHRHMFKISHSGNALDESSRPIQGNEILTVQELLTALDDGFATVPLILPQELVERILLFLDAKSVMTCRLANKEFNNIIQSSTLLQYFLACKAVGVIGNSQSPLAYPERFEALKKWEDAWRKLKPVFESTIKIIDQPSTLLELTAGHCFLTDNDRKYLYYRPLPSSAQDNSQWTKVPGHGPGQGPSGHIINTCMAIYEHDLIVNVISSDETDTQRHSLDLVLLEFSSGKYHPLARHPRIHVQKSYPAQPSVVLRIVGNNLALIVDTLIYSSRLYIFDWKTGHKRLQHEVKAYAHLYSSLVFVSPELLLVANITLFHFEIWHLPPSDTNTNPPVLILCLQLPAISKYCTVDQIRCHGEVSPFLHSMPHFPSRPFFPSPEDSIININFSFASHRILQNGDTYSFVVHRHALLNTIRKWASSLLVEQHLQGWTNEAIVHEVADPDVRLGAHVENMSESSSQIRDSHPTLRTLYSFASAYSGSSSSIPSGSSTPPCQYNAPIVRWADWGPPISRWFQIDDSYEWSVNQSTGQRYAFLHPNPIDWTRPVHVADFNPYNVRRNEEMTAQSRKEGVNKLEEGKKEELEILDHDGLFAEEVYMGLKCVIYRTPDEYDFDAVFMNEESVLGLKFDWGNIEDMRVLYIG